MCPGPRDVLDHAPGLVSIQVFLAVSCTLAGGVNMLHLYALPGFASRSEGALPLSLSGAL